LIHDVVASRHETKFEGPEIEGARCRRLRQAQGRSREDLLCFYAHHKALAKKTSRDWGSQVQADPWQTLQQRGNAKRVASTEHLEANDDLTLEEHRQAFEEEFGQRVSTSTIGRAIAALPDGGWPLKKVTDSL
jgi:transposase